MEEFNKKEQWLNEVMSSLDGVQRAQPKDDLFASIEAALPSNIVPIRTIAKQRLYWLGLAASLLISINVYALVQPQQPTQQVEATALFLSYELYE